MKLTFVITFLCSISAFAEGYGQRINIELKNAAVESVLKEIKKQSGYDMFYNIDLISPLKKTNFRVKNATLEDALKEVTTNLGLAYAIEDRMIIISKRKENRIIQHSIKGTVSGEGDKKLQGVSVVEKGTSNGTTTDVDGNYSIKVSNPRGVLIFSIVGYARKEVPIDGLQQIDVQLTEDKSELDEVVVVAYGQQKKESMVSSITTINPKELKGPTSNLTTMLAGRLSGVVAFQRSGEPGADNAQFFIRGITTFGSGKVDPLILIDGMESTSNDLARLQPDDISGFSVLKDAAASSLYGARGANGVVLVTTKSGVTGKTKFNVRAENSISSNTQNFKLADNITYMKLANEAVLTRNALEDLPYSQNKIDRTIAGDNPFLYPNNDWIDLLIKDYTINQRFNMNMSGGGKNAQFYIAGTYNVDNGVLKSDHKNKFDNNINLKSYQIRSNVNVKLTPTTEGIVRTSGSFDDYQGPIGGGGNIFQGAIAANPVNFPAVFPASDMPFAEHPLFGNARINGQTEAMYFNPYAEMVSGFQQSNSSTLNVQLEVKQDFKFLTEGLSARVMAYTQRYSYFDVRRRYTPFYYRANATSTEGDKYTLELLNEKDATEYLDFKPGTKVANTVSYLEAAVNYNHTFSEKHSVGGLLVTQLRSFVSGDADKLQNSLPYRNQGLSGRFTYGYDGRYLLEANFGLNGSERFAKNHRYGFFPSIGVAWNASNEEFFRPLRQAITKLKFRATYGLIGNDQIGDRNDRFFYLSDVNLKDGAHGSSFGTNYIYSKPGVTISRYANEAITWEQASTVNLGMDLSLFNSVNIILDAYKTHRKNILMNRSYIPTTMGLSAGIRANVGEAEGKGVDLSVDYNKNFGDMWIQARGTFTYATSKLLVNEEPNYPSNLAYLSRIGRSLSQGYGLIAERLFVDNEEVKNSPVQNFGEVMGGDIKYRDMNGDGVITSQDYVPLGLPTVPEIIYGFGLSVGYKQFDLSGFFQGSGRSSFWIDPDKTSPFVMNGPYQHGLLQAIADDHWSEENGNIYAFWPRLSPNLNRNNLESSSWWMRNGSFLRLKTVELGYNLSSKMLDKMGVGPIRLYLNASNLFVKSSFNLWDPEMGGNGLRYPLQKVYNFGLNVQF
ncbi:TonB-dependent receptor [Sphingobacterium sp. NGMCC 1.201703]|jgi:TonB-linked SusC/RagA family outer membrane protein|uniref:TonB-dependent receptor n=1 Tax=unclassified Sphingobacterium TaxID=2609468 RepID=UPI00098478C7|nr:TonB-dependent receptor [Sphingobacterium sp. CZ-UAM]